MISFFLRLTKTESEGEQGFHARADGQAARATDRLGRPSWGSGDQQAGHGLLTSMPSLPGSVDTSESALSRESQ